jgi:hypothetical protein
MTDKIKIELWPEDLQTLLWEIRNIVELDGPPIDFDFWRQFEAMVRGQTEGAAVSKE